MGRAGRWKRTYTASTSEKRHGSPLARVCFGVTGTHLPTEAEHERQPVVVVRKKVGHDHP